MIFCMKEEHNEEPKAMYLYSPGLLFAQYWGKIWAKNGPFA